MIDLNRVRGTRMRHDPYALAIIDGMLDARWARTLCEEFPSEGFHLDAKSERTAEKRYRSYNLGVVDRSRPLDWAWDRLSPAWQRFVTELLGTPYRTAISDVAALPLADCEVEVRLCRYEAGCWIDPHTDRPDKRLTQIIYLNPEWDPHWGGNLLILRSRDVSDIAATVPPRLGTSVLIKPSKSSWHAVQPVVGRVRAQRRSVLLHFAAPPATGAPESP